MNWVTFDKETINLDNVTHIEQGEWERQDGTNNPYIRFHFVGGYAGESEDCVNFNQFTWDNKPVLAYHEAKDWLEHFQRETKKG